MARDKWMNIQTGDRIKVTPKPTAPPSAPISCVAKGIKVFNGNIIGVYVDDNGAEKCYPTSLYSVTKDNG